MADQPGRAQLGVALDQYQTDARPLGQGAKERGLAGARRPFEQDAAPGGQGGGHHLDVAPATDEDVAGRRHHPDRRERSDEGAAVSRKR